jgi:hypothetical protein
MNPKCEYNVRQRQSRDIILINDGVLRVETDRRHTFASKPLSQRRGLETLETNGAMTVHSSHTHNFHSKIQLSYVPNILHNLFKQNLPFSEYTIP